MASNQRVLSAVRNGPVRRSLFGPVDSEQLRRDYRAALDKDLREASSRWSFDFVRDRPLEHGDFQWEGVPGAKVPLLYRSSVDDHQVAPERRDQAALEVKQVKQVKQVESESESEKENNVPGSPRRHAVNLLKLEKTPEKDQRAGLKRKQTNITGRPVQNRVRTGLSTSISGDNNSGGFSEGHPEPRPSNGPDPGTDDQLIIANELMSLLWLNSFRFRQISTRPNGESSGCRVNPASEDDVGGIPEGRSLCQEHRLPASNQQRLSS